MRRWVGIAVVATLLAGCGQDAELEVEGTPGSAAEVGVAWEHLNQVEGILPDRAAAMVVEDAEQAAAAWDEHGFEGQPPAGPFVDHVLLLVGQADDACPDELIGLEVVAGELEVDWLSPPGGCNEPLIYRLHAVQVHRGVLGDEFSFGLEPPFDGELDRVNVELPAYDGQAPPAPVPPQSMTEDELDAVFDGHPVVRCGPEHELIDFGPADETAAEPAANPDEMIGPANDALTAAGIDIGRQVVPFIDRTTGGALAYFASENAAPTAEQTLLDQFGDHAPAVHVSPWAPAEVHDAQEAIGTLMTGSDEPGAIVETTGAPGPAKIGVIDPTREALDAIAETVDPELVCVNPILSGVRTTDGDQASPAAGE